MDLLPGTRTPSRPNRPGVRAIPAQRFGVDSPDERTRRKGIVYGAICFDVDPDTGLIRMDPATGQPGLRMDYVGQTRQKLSAREEQHRDEKPFADLIVRFVVIEQGDWTNQELTARETAAIHGVKPRYNDRENRGNPDRIEIWSPTLQQWRQMKQRWARDKLADLELWQPGPDRPEYAALGLGPAVPAPAADPSGVPAGRIGMSPLDVARAVVRAVRGWPPLLRRAVLVLAAGATAVAVTAQCLAEPAPWPVSVVLPASPAPWALAAVLHTLLLVLGWVIGPPKRRRKRR